MIYNSTKTCCMSFLPHCFRKLYVPSVYLGQKKLKWVEEKDYLGVTLCKDAKDNTDIERQIKAIYRQGNSIIRRFYMCTDDVKVQLFITFCYSMYGIALWFDFSFSKLNSVGVAYNNIFRQFLKLNRRCSISLEYLNRNVNSFFVCLRKSINSLYSRLRNSNNTLIETIINSPYFVYSSNMHSQWKRILYV